MKILIIATPNFNLAATANFIDPFRAINYLDGASHFHWTLASVKGGMCEASNGLSVATQDLKSALAESWDLAIVSSSWAPERHSSSALLQAMRRVARSGCVVGALDTGSFILARAGLLNGRIATTHYEHIDALMELYPAITVVEELFVFDGNRITCCGGAASIDFSLHIIEEQLGATRATNAARYLYHQSLRPVGARQVPEPWEPLGSGIPNAVRQAIEVMESQLENIVTIPDICEQIGVSQRQLDRLFATYVKKTPARYYPRCPARSCREGWSHRPTCLCPALQSPQASPVRCTSAAPTSNASGFHRSRIASRGEFRSSIARAPHAQDAASEGVTIAARKIKKPTRKV